MLKLTEMKRKIIITGALTLLLGAIIFMAWDMFFNKPGNNVNPYAYDLKTVKSGDTSQVMYAEVRHFEPSLPAIHAIAADRNGLLYVAGEKGVELFDTSGRRITGFIIDGAASAVTVDGKGQIFLGIGDHIEVFEKSGKRIKKWAPCGPDAIITSVAVRGSDVYVADAANKVACHFDLSGNLVKKIGEKDPARKIPGFVVPSPYFDLGIGPEGELWVVNPGRHRLEKYNREGDLTFSWGESTMSMEGFCGCCNPSNFALMADGSFVTSEKGIERIKVYSPEGVFRHVVAGPDAFTEGTKGLDLAVDPSGRIVVLDPGKKQIRIFSLKKN